MKIANGFNWKGHCVEARNMLKIKVVDSDQILSNQTIVRNERKFSISSVRKTEN